MHMENDLSHGGVQHKDHQERNDGWYLQKLQNAKPFFLMLDLQNQKPMPTSESTIVTKTEDQD